MIRIAATLLEQFRRFCEEEYVKQEDLIAQVLGKPFEPSWQMRAGTAWGELLADPSVGEQTCDLDGITHDGYIFDRPTLYQTRQRIGPGLWEVKATRLLNVFGVPVTLVAQVDHVNGSEVAEIKTRWGSGLSTADYERSLQWRTYLYCHQAASCRYHLFAFKEPKEGYCELREVLSPIFWNYEGLEFHLRHWCGLFLDWCHQHKLTEFLHRESRKPAKENV